MRNFLVLVFLSVAAFLCAKEISVYVYDKDLETPLEGVKIIEPVSGTTYFTDDSGKASIKIDDKSNQAILLFYLIGYQSKKIASAEFGKSVGVPMVIEGMVEGRELVVEGSGGGRKNDEVGVSKVVDKEELKATAMTGVVQDVMSTIKTLPGVIYSSKFSSGFSIRGGEPSELTTVMDGFVVRHPWHWGGTISIFNPNTVDDVKFSAGIFAVKYGSAMSGLMEVNMITPDDGVKVDGTLSSMTAELLLQTPIVDRKKSGLFVGGRFTSMDLSMMMMQPLMRNLGASYTRTPYIYDGYFKWYFKPVNNFEWYVNGFFGTDGIGLKYQSPTIDPDEDISDRFTFFWENYSGFVNTGFKTLITKNVFVHFLAGYEYYRYSIDGKSESFGSTEYSDDFIDKFGALLGGKTGYDLDIDSSFKSSQIEHALQSRLDVDVTVNEILMLSLGGGVNFEYNTQDEDGKYWTIEYNNGVPEYIKKEYGAAQENKGILRSFVYSNFVITPLADILKIETGIRADHNYIISDNYRLNTYPTAGPRLNITYTPFKNLKYLDSFTLSLGTGIFTKIPDSTTRIKKEYGLHDFDISIPKAFTSVVGMEFQFPFGIKFKTEGYYKYLFNGFYINLVSDRLSDGSYEIDPKIHSDGYGHVAGVDISLEKKLSRYVDGTFSYSFNYSRKINPSANGIKDGSTLQGEPTGIWYYPRYHRFHNLNLVLNLRPTSWFTITPKLSFASGLPKAKISSSKDMFAAVIKNDDGSTTVLEMYSRDSKYSDTLRTDFSVPFDLKLAFDGYLPKTKVHFDVYIAAEDIFSPIYTPKGNVQTNQFNGEEELSPESGYNSGVPTVSFGINFNY